MSWLLPVFLLFCLAAGAARRVPVYDAFLEGAREGLATARAIAPPLVAMLSAIRAFAACGLMRHNRTFDTDSFRKAFGHQGFRFHVQHLIFQRRAAGINHEYFHLN